VVIAKAALKEYLEAPMRDTSVKVKVLPDEKLDAIIAKQGLQFLTPPRRAQKVCMVLGWKFSRFLFLLGMGGGKTKICLDLFRNKRREGESARMLVLVPNIVNLDAWAEEVRLHAHDTLCGVVDQSGAASRWAMLESKAEIVVMTYAGLVSLLSKSKKPDPEAIKRLGVAFEMLVLDECTSVKNPNTSTFKIIRKLRKYIASIYGLTGTPFDKNPIDLWSQFFAIDGGETLGETLGIYREAFFRQERQYFGGVDYVFRKRKWRELSQRLTNRSIRYSEAECQDLPPAVGGLDGNLMLVPVRLSKDVLPYYTRIDTELTESKGDYQLVNNAYIRMRMLCSGWLGAKTEDGERVEIVFPTNPTFDAVEDLLGRIPEEEKVIVVTWFNTTGRLLMERLGKGAVLINGTTSPKSKREAMEAFRGDGGPRVLVGSTAISKGVNLQAASRHMIFVESPDSVIERSQLEARIRREGGGGKTVYYYDIVPRLNGLPTVTEKILESLTTGRKLHDVLINRKKRTDYDGFDAIPLFGKD